MIKLKLKDVFIESNSCFHRLSLKTYENKFKAAYGHVINCFHKLSQAIYSSAYVSR